MEPHPPHYRLLDQLTVPFFPLSLSLTALPYPAPYRGARFAQQGGPLFPLITKIGKPIINYSPHPQFESLP